MVTQCLILDVKDIPRRNGTQQTDRVISYTFNAVVGETPQTINRQLTCRPEDELHQAMPGGIFVPSVLEVKEFEGLPVVKIGGPYSYYEPTKAMTTRARAKNIGLRLVG